MPLKPVISIIGPGKVGTALGVLAARAGYRVAIGGRRRAAVVRAANTIGRRARAVTPHEAAALGDIVLLTVTDEVIGPICEKLARAKAFVAGAVVTHCSGAIGSDVLEPAKRLCRCRIGSMHPLQTFPSANAAVARLPDAYVFCEGDAVAVRKLQAFARRIGVKPFRLRQSRSKALYHAAAVTACNYLAALMDAAMVMMQAAGVPSRIARPAMEKIVRATLDNITALGPAKALTGPIARGDISTVRRNLQACPKELQRLYRAMGDWTVNLAQRGGKINDTTAKALRRILKDCKER